MELTLLIPVILGVITGILYTYSSQYDYDEYKYQCHQCKKKFRKDESKDWTCPHCNHQNVTLKSYDY